MNTFNTGAQSLVREINLSSVLRYLHSSGPLSRAQLANVTGLNKSTVSSLVEELIDRNLIHEVGMNNSGTGRPAMLLEWYPQAGCIIGIELGVDFVAIILTNFVGEILWRRQIDIDPLDSQEAILDQTLTLADEAANTNATQGLRLLGLGLATPGIVNMQDGMLIFAPNLHWRNVPLGKIFAEHLKIPVIVDNDANAAALGEHLFGIARQLRSFVFIFAGVGMGGGLFLNGELYRGMSGYAGEIGHCTFLVEPFQIPCHCGNRGCWETYANQFSIVERVRARLEVKRTSIIPELMKAQHSPLNLSIITKAAEAGDAQAREVLTEAGAAMGIGVANLINIFNPEMVVIGGPLSWVGKFMLPAAMESVYQRALPEIACDTPVVLSAAGPDASLIGAVSLVVNVILTNPTSVDKISKLIAQIREEVVE
jgi:glucokinase-like ROK family protein